MDDANTIIAFIKAQKGYLPFYWTPPGEPAAKLWRCKNIKANPSGPWAKTVSLTFTKYDGPV